MDCSPPGSSAHGISQARVPEWAATSSSKESSRPRDQTHISCTSRQFFTAEPAGTPSWFITGSWRELAVPSSRTFLFICFIYGSLWVPSCQTSSPGPPRASELASHVMAQHIPARTPASECQPSTSLPGPHCKLWSEGSKDHLLTVPTLTVFLFFSFPFS